MENVRPLNGFVLVERLEKEQKVGSVILPDSAEGTHWIDARVIRLPEDFFASTSPKNLFLSEGDTVKLYEHNCSFLDMEEKHALVPISSVLLKEIPTSLENDEYTGRLVEFESWDEFTKSDFEHWEKLSDFTRFNFALRLLRPFASYEGLSRRLHECLIEVLRGVDDLDLSNVSFSHENGTTFIRVNDDVWHSQFAVDEDENVLILDIASTSFRGMHKTIPVFFDALHLLLESSEFTALSGKDYSRIPVVTLNFHQRIRLFGRGKGRLKEDVRNSDLMQQFINFGEKEKKATLDALGVTGKDFKRIDMKLSFQKLIADHEYSVFFDVEAPANDDQSLFEIKWQLQDRAPGTRVIRDYTPLFTDFMRDTVLRTFYRRWFLEKDDIDCSTEKR